MLKSSLPLVCLAALLAAAPSLHAQAKPTATRGGGNIQAGLGVLYLNPDYNSDAGNNVGFTVFADYDFFRYLGVEADVHSAGIISPGDITENSYMFGPRAMYHFHKFNLYGKLLFGEATINDQDAPSGQSYFNAYNPSKNFFVYAYGGGIDYRLKKHINIRLIDFETQTWGNFEPHNLSPYGITVGVAYVIR